MVAKILASILDLIMLLMIVRSHPKLIDWLSRTSGINTQQSALYIRYTHVSFADVCPSLQSLVNPILVYCTLHKIVWQNLCRSWSIFNQRKGLGSRSDVDRRMLYIYIYILISCHQFIYIQWISTVNPLNASCRLQTLDYYDHSDMASHSTNTLVMNNILRILLVLSNNHLSHSYYKTHEVSPVQTNIQRLWTNKAKTNINHGEFGLNSPGKQVCIM